MKLKINSQPTYWYPANKIKIPNNLKDFLLNPGSTTQRMQEEYGEETKVDIMMQAWGKPTKSEANYLRIQEDQKVLIRETYLNCQNKTWMFARAIFPLELFEGKMQYLLDELNARPLGKLLFNEPSLRRSEFEIAILQEQHFEYQRAVQKHQTSNVLWARRSIFWLHEKPLLLMEVLFPEVLQLIKVKP